MLSCWCAEHFTWHLLFCVASQMLSARVPPPLCPWTFFLYTYRQILCISWFKCFLLHLCTFFFSENGKLYSLSICWLYWFLLLYPNYRQASRAGVRHKETKECKTKMQTMKPFYFNSSKIILQTCNMDAHLNRKDAIVTGSSNQNFNISQHN